MPCQPKKCVKEPKVVYRDIFHPQPVEIVQPIEIVNRHHFVPVPYVVTTVTVRDEFPSCGVAGIRGMKKKSPSRKK
ncbi:hypothetical protein [Paenibacillus sp.]|uniref:hypothetical protein n=1 Tax=Paenibacillus sp. TaxID=58172 RepID=UPI002D271192|nr:hypothetical protein [Paenibacillus sp.]HZG86285.1 hypothetical protein [Paenibacillus sp.]